jgi:hypothetical protein
MIDSISASQTELANQPVSLPAENSAENGKVESGYDVHQQVSLFEDKNQVSWT